MSYGTCTQHYYSWWNSPITIFFWKAEYDEEFYGLQEIPAWNLINDHEYQKLCPLVGEVLPSMTISTIKYDKHGNLKRVKWRILDLGNIDPHEWTNTEVYDPVMSIFELTNIISLAMHHNRPIQCGDVKQGFVKATLHENEQNVFIPIASFPNSKAFTYCLIKLKHYV